MLNYKLIHEILTFRAKSESNHLAFTYLENGENIEQNITYAQLEFEARKIAGYLKTNFNKGDRAILFFPPGLDFIKAFFGCLYSGIVAVPSYPPKRNRNAERINTIINESKPSIIFTDSSLGYKKILENQMAIDIPIVDIDKINSKNAECFDNIEILPEDIAFLQFTSGSIADPKGVIITHENLLHNEQLIQSSFKLSSKSIVVGWLPLYHDMGLIGNILQPIFTGFRCILMSPSHFLQKPVRWLQAISNYKATISGGPNFAFDLCCENISENEFREIDLASWEVAFNGSETVRSKTIEKFNIKFKHLGFNETAFLPCYGMAETTLLVSSINVDDRAITQKFTQRDLQFYKNDFNNQLEEKETELISCGKWEEGYNIILVDENNKVVKDETVGEILISGKSVSRGYWNDQLKENNSFNTKIKGYKETFLRTGDLGIIKNNELFIAGRLKDIIIINGRNYYPQDIEYKTAKSNDLIIKDSVASFSIEINSKEELVVIAEVENKTDFDTKTILSDVKKSLIKEFEIIPNDIVLIRRGTLLKTTSGKIRRKVCQQAYLNNSFTIINSLTSKQVRKNIDLRKFNPKEIEIYNIVKKEIKGHLTDKNDDLVNLGLDSISLTRIVYQLGEFYNKKLDVNFIFENNTISKIAKNISIIKNEYTPENKNNGDVFPASKLQELIWFNQQRKRNGTGYNIPILFEYNEEIKPNILSKTLGFLFSKYEILRTNFYSENGSIKQKIKSFDEVFLEIIDLSVFNDNYINEKLTNTIKEKATQPFNLEKDILFRIFLIKISNCNYRILIVIHHIIVDGTSIMVLLNEFNNKYKAFLNNKLVKKELPENNFIDFVLNENKTISNLDELTSKREFWLHELHGELPVINLPLDNSFDKSNSREGGSYYFKLSNKLFNLIKKYENQPKTNLFSYLLTAYILLIHRLNGSNDIIVGLPISLRNTKSLENTPGLFINTVMFRTLLKQNYKLKTFVEKVYEHSRHVLQNSDYPFSQLLKELRIPIGDNQLAISSLFFNYLNFINTNDSESIFKNFQANLGVDLNFDVNFYVLPSTNDISFRIDYCKNHFKYESIKSWTKLYIEILTEIIEHPETKIKDLKPVIKEILNPIKVENNFTPFPKNDIKRTIVSKIDEVFTKYSDKVALKTESKDYTYNEISSISNGIANIIHSKYCTQPDAIGLLFGHEPYMIFSIIAVIKSGNYYVPLDLEYPLERLTFIQNDSKIKIIITNDKNIECAKLLVQKSKRKIQIINIDDYKKWDNNSVRNISLNSSSLAYILYTSGSTGTPKGVMQTHGYVMHITYSFTNSLQISKKDCFTLIPSFNFSASVMDLFGALLNGASLYLIDIKKDGISNLLANIIKKEVTIYHSVPTIFREFSNEISKVKSERIDLKSIRLVYLAGEPLVNNDVKLYRKYFSEDCILVNGLGCTEYNICRQYFIDKKTDILPNIVPVGYKALGVDVHIIDEKGNISKNHEVGEIAITSKYLSKGYWNNSQLTNKKFRIFNKENNERIYYTGDIGRKLTDGTLLHLGRKDFQVKIRGQRIELGEIESLIMEIDGLYEAVVTTKEYIDNKFLCAFFVGKDNVDKSIIIDYLTGKLPSFMLPSMYVKMNSLPHLPNGKVNRKELSIPDNDISKVNYSPKSILEKKLLSLWKNVLNKEIINESDDFFEIGGHSLKAMQLQSLIRDELNINITLQDIFSNSVFNKQIQLLAKNFNVYELQIKYCEKREYYPLSLAQKRFYILQNLNKESVAFNIPSILEFKGKINIERIKLVINKIIQKHEPLRTTIKLVKGSPMQFIDHELNIDICNLEDDNFESFIQPFDLDNGPLIRVGIFRHTIEHHTIIIDMHHIISDGSSLGVIIKDFNNLYENSESQKLLWSYKDYSVWQSIKYLKKNLHKEEKYWIDRFCDDIPILNLPFDKIRSKTLNFNGNRMEFIIKQDITDSLNRIANEEGVTLFMLVLGIYNIFLSKLSSQEDIVIGCPVAGRTSSKLHALVGLFINTLPLRNFPNNNKKFHEFLLEIKQNVIESFENQSYPYEELLDNISLKHDAGRNSLFDTMFVLQNMEINDFKLDNLIVKASPFRTKSSKYDISLFGIEKQNEISFEFEYNTDLFDDSTIKRFIAYFKNVIYQIVADHKKTIANYFLRTEEENNILNEFNNTDISFGQKTISTIFKEQVKKYKNSVAVIFGNDKITYKELDIKSSKLAIYLRVNGVDKDVPVGLFFDRSIEMIIGILGVIKSGGTFVPIDPESPEVRNRQIIDNCRLKIIISRKAIIGSKFRKNNIILLDCFDYRMISERGFEAKDTGSSVAYLIHTSGTSGTPKGVMVRHNSFINLCQWYIHSHKISNNSNVILIIPYTFDASLKNIICPLLRGGKLILTPNGFFNASNILKIILSQKITHLNCVPSAFYPLIELSKKNNFIELSTIKNLALGGEALKIENLRPLIKVNSQIKISNIYGPTECTDIALAYYLNSDFNKDIVPIGKSIPNSKAYILDKNNFIQPIGVHGELCISGTNLANGYYRDSKLTNEKFIDNPFQEGQKLYKTGDLARINSDGDIFFLGRIDNQVKIRGNRIELSEIENELLKIPEINEALVTVFDDEGENLLCAYLVSENLPIASFIQKSLSKRLPGYMIPTFFIKLKSIPLTANGKINKKLLPAPSKSIIKRGKECILPNTKTEKVLAQIWEVLLKRTNISIHDNFFEIGGHSLKAVSLVTEVYQKFDVEIELKDIFERSTIYQIADIIDNSVKKKFKEIEQLPKSNYYEASQTQKHIWLLDRYNNDSFPYNIVRSFNIKGDLDIPALEKSFNELVIRHEILRTSFKYIDDDLKQIVESGYENGNYIRYIDLSKLNPNKDVLEKYKSEVGSVFNIKELPLFRIILIKYEEDKYLFHFAIHRIIADGWSLKVLFNDVFTYYNAFSQGLEPKLDALRVHYKDYVNWFNKKYGIKKLNDLKKYWLEKMSGNIPVIDLPIKNIRPKKKTFNGKIDKFIFNSEFQSNLNEIAKSENTSLFVVLLSILKVLIYKYTGLNDIVIGTPVAGREHIDLRNQIGIYLNFIPLRTQFNDDISFIEFLNLVKKTTIVGFQNQAYPFNYLVKELNRNIDLSRSPLFDITIVLQNAEFEISEKNLHGIQVFDEENSFSTSIVDMGFYFKEEKDELHMQIEYNTDLYSSEIVMQFYESFKNLGFEIFNALNKNISEFQILNKAQKKLLTSKFNNTYKNELIGKNIIELFKEQVNKLPNTIALNYGDINLTYLELDILSSSFAKFLIDKTGFPEEEIIAYTGSKSDKYLISILAILKAGGAFLPIDLKLSSKRIYEILKNANVRYSITDVLNEHIFKGIKTYNISDFLNMNKKGSCHINKILKPQNLAYVIYTSGSTGTPKGVMIEHRGIANMSKDQIKIFNINQEDRIILFASISFDASISEIFMSFFSGASLIIPDEVLIHDKNEIVSFLQIKNISIATMPPSYLKLFDPKELNSLKSVISAGEPAHPEFANSINGHFDYFNAYGPSEYSVCVSVHKISNQIIYNSNVPIGKPIANTKVYILDKFLNILPQYTSGEIYVEGIGLSRGYLLDDYLTSKKFIKNPFGKGLLYKSGDIGRWIENGDIEFIGRNDEQVKIRGFRIELNEIKFRILKIRYVDDAIVRVCNFENDEKKLCAYFTSNEKLNIESIKSQLSEYLPDYMVPPFFIQIDKFTYTSSGKIDVKTLPSPTDTINKDLYVPPSNEIEKKLVTIWENLLGIEKIGTTDNFFGLGGHSLQVTQLIYKLHEELNVKISFQTIFTDPTIKELSKIIAKQKISLFSSIKSVEKKQYYEISRSQKRIWILSQIENASLAYNLPGVFEIKGEINIDALKYAFIKTINRHESLRTSFITINGKPRQVVCPLNEIKFSIEIVDLKGIPNNSVEVDQIIHRSNFATFDLTAPPLLKVKLIQLKSNFHILCFNIHHIISDGWSTGVFISDILNYYNTLLLKKPTNKDPLKIQYKDFSNWQNITLNENVLNHHKDYWLNMFSLETPILDFPTDFKRPKIRTYNGNTVSFKISPQLTTLLNEICKKDNVTLYMVLISVVKTLIYKYTGQTDIVIGSPVAGREHIDLEKQIGLYVNTIALRTKFKSENTFEELLKIIKPSILDAYEHQLFPFDVLVESLNLVHDLSRNPLFDIMVALQNFNKTEALFNEIEISTRKTKNSISKFDLSFNFTENKDYIDVDLEYNTDLYNTERILRLQDHLLTLIKSIVQCQNTSLEKIEYISENEKTQILHSFNNTKVEYQNDLTIHDLFHERMFKNEDKIALVFEDHAISYRELNNRSERISLLLNEMGVKPNTIVGVLMERSIEMMIGIYGILKAGGVYLPIDIEIPENRKKIILKDSNTEIILTNIPILEEEKECKTYINLKYLDFKVEKKPIKRQQSSSDCAYVIYTSGTSGLPKGVMIEHKSLLNRLNWMQSNYHLSEKDILIQKTPYSFDVSVWELFWWFFGGSRLILLKHHMEKDVYILSSSISKYQVTTIHFVPSMLKLFLDYVKPEGREEYLKSLRFIFSSGEALPINTVKKFFKILEHKKYETSLINLYGPTEATIDVSYYNCNSGSEIIPIGKPISNIRLLILNECNDIQPIGIPGELCISGIGLSRGYIQKPELTADKFIKTNYYNREIFYKTGDLARWLPDGNIEYLGRIDKQIKIRGNRVEVEEIENILISYHEIKDAIVHAFEDQNAHVFLRAFLVLNEIVPITTIKNKLKKDLPEYMIPNNFTILEKIPLTRNGKIDFKILPELKSEESIEFEPVKTETEIKIANMLSEILKVELETIGNSSNFFEIGGNSLTANQLNEMIYNEFNITLNIKDFFISQTVEEIASVVDNSCKIITINELEDTKEETFI